MTVKILLVEDDESDVIFVKRYIKSNNLDLELIVAKDGVEALQIMRGTHYNAPLECPYIVVTDINMPVMSGHELIQELRTDPNLKRTIIFVLTSSLLKSDIQLAYELNISGYFVKDENVINECLSLLTKFCTTATLETPV